MVMETKEKACSIRFEGFAFSGRVTSSNKQATPLLSMQVRSASPSLAAEEERKEIR